jgi:hypothetical protein
LVVHPVKESKYKHVFRAIDLLDTKTGIRYYFLVRYRLSRGLDLWIRFGSTVYPDPAFTDENGELPEPRQELKGQIRWQF